MNHTDPELPDLPFPKPITELDLRCLIKTSSGGVITTLAVALRVTGTATNAPYLRNIVMNVYADQGRLRSDNNSGTNIDYRSTQVLQSGGGWEPFPPIGLLSPLILKWHEHLLGSLC